MANLEWTMWLPLANTDIIAWAEITFGILTIAGGLSWCSLQGLWSICQCRCFKVCKREIVHPFTDGKSQSSRYIFYNVNTNLTVNNFNSSLIFTDMIMDMLGIDKVRNIITEKCSNEQNDVKNAVINTITNARSVFNKTKINWVSIMNVIL